MNHKESARLGVYFTLGDGGSLAHSVAALTGAAQGGAQLLEVGLPFSDPLLDGPVIQASHGRAVASGQVCWADVCAAINDLKKTGVAISLMGSVQLLYEKSRREQLPKVNGILLTDLSHDRPCPFLLPSPRVWFLAPDLVLSNRFQDPPEDISMCYLTRVQGLTGAGQNAQVSLEKAVSILSQKVTVPIWLGFGITQKTDILNAAKGAHGGIVGSRFVSDIQSFCQASPKTPAQVHEFAKQWVKDFLA